MPRERELDREDGRGSPREEFYKYWNFAGISFRE